MAAKKRRLQTNLYISGLVFILLGIWALVKGAVQIMMILMEQTVDEAAAAEDEEILAELIEFLEALPRDFLITVAIILGAAVLLFIGFAIFLHVYIGRSAMKAARGKKKTAYLVMVVVYIVVMVAGYIFSIGEWYDFDVQDALQIIIDLTTVFCLGVIFVSSVKLRKMEKAGSGADGASSQSEISVSNPSVSM